MSRFIFLIIFIVSISNFTPVFADQQYQSEYAGQEMRSIKSLSNNDIEQLKSGKGWGLAKAAELNGMPGPSHLLQMKNEISLSKQQEEKIRLLFEEMKSKAIPLGNELIELEKKLNNAFANRTITDEILSQQLDAISVVRKKLRYIHLQTHLLTPAILTEQQIQKYNQLRGYGTGDPCRNPPKGHDIEMWKKHNDCA